MLGIQSEYGFTVAPDPLRELATGYDGWTAAGVDSTVIVPRTSTHLEYTDINYVLPASRYGQALSSAYTQARLANYLQHDPSPDAALLGPTLHYLEPDPTGTWQPLTLERTERLSFYPCSGYDITTDLATPSGRQTDDDNSDVGC